ncbi:formylglycine-generating enzyme family protein, partial [bacterium]|nr:formylglycine-generating enzyme family protein [bacterium]
ALMGANPSKYKNSDHPVDGVLWDDCQRFIEKLNTLHAGTFRLPTEAEWEYACRAGSATRYYWGDDNNFIDMPDYAWYDGNSGHSTHPVGAKQPNVWGLDDMSGNVNEWCQDFYAPYSSEPQTDPLAADGTIHIKRGGGFYDFAWNARSAARNPETNPTQLDLLGLRVVREVE